MATQVYKHLFKLSLVTLLVGCAGEPVTNQVERPKNTSCSKVKLRLSVIR